MQRTEGTISREEINKITTKSTTIKIEMEDIAGQQLKNTNSCKVNTFLMLKSKF